MGTSPVDAKTERLLNLVLALLATRRPLSKETLRRQVLQYEQFDDELFDRMFERDKEELRELGIPLLVAPLDAFFDDEVGYRIDRGAYSLPPISFTAAEVEAVRLAARTWAQSAMAPTAAMAIRKLAAAGVEAGDAAPLDPGITENPPDPQQFGVSTDVPAFEPLKAAVLAQRAVTFEYRNARGGTGVRHLQPWQLQAWHGRWYVTGLDTGKGEPRIFRLDRIASPVTPVGKAGAYTIPGDHDAMAMIRRQVDPGAAGQATVFVARRAGMELRRRGRVVGGDAPPGFDTVLIEYTDIERMAGELARYGPDVIVAAPKAVRLRVVTLLRGVVARTKEAQA